MLPSSVRVYQASSLFRRCAPRPLCAAQSSTTWDENKIYGCVCDSAWTVGYGPGQYQATQWFGADCSLKHCPSADDPRTTAIESDCEWCGEQTLPVSLPLGRVLRPSAPLARLRLSLPPSLQV